MSSTEGAEVPGGRLTPVSLRLVSDAAYEQLKNKIVTGELVPGTRLVETKCAGDLGVSQSTVREALARLARDGLVLSIPRRGSYVASLPADTIYHLYEMRERIEPLAMRLAMKALSQADHDYLERQLDRLAARTISERIDADMAFHERLYELSGFPPLQSLWPQIEALTRKFFSTSRRLTDAEQIKHTHRAIMRALTDEDEEALEEALQLHMRQTSLLMKGRADPDLPHATRGGGSSATGPPALQLIQPREAHSEARRTSRHRPRST